jgi:hypothetical protein
MRIASVTLALLLCGTLPALAQGKKPDLLANPGDLKWLPAPPVLPAGAQIAVLSGDPTKSGPYVLRLKMPANYEIPAHHHPTVENVTVISGSFHAGMGNKLDEAHGVAFTPGGFVSMPANMNHYAWTTNETVVQVHGDGPFSFVYVDAAAMK